MKVTIRRKKKTVFQLFHQNIVAARKILGVFSYRLAASRKIDLDTAKLTKMNQDRKIGELEEGIKANSLVLLDIQIDHKKLELLALRRKIGDLNDFAPENQP